MLRNRINISAMTLYYLSSGCEMEWKRELTNTWNQWLHWDHGESGLTYSSEKERKLTLLIKHFYCNRFSGVICLNELGIWRVQCCLKVVKQIRCKNSPHTYTHIHKENKRIYVSETLRHLSRAVLLRTVFFHHTFNTS